MRLAFSGFLAGFIIGVEAGLLMGPRHAVNYSGTETLQHRVEDTFGSPLA
jgi:hypothetical protein